MSAENGQDWYKRMLNSVEWQRVQVDLRLREDFTCQCCKDKTTPFDIHHIVYHGRPFDANKKDLLLLCRHCHRTIEMFKIPWGKGLKGEKSFSDSLSVIKIWYDGGLAVGSFDSNYVGHIVKIEDDTLSKIFKYKMNQWLEGDELRLLRGD